ncbi:hypothetical protein EES43_07795 [Streptomyces sp. ADI96-02]|nr:hypothetical protein EES43_07795 [Streptomyces sp. ADI96-02]
MLKVLAEHDELGREAFLTKYGFGEARSYVLVHEGQEYDSKAVAGVAHKWDQGRVLTRDEFSGGKDHAAAWLKRVGFPVKAIKNPDWARDEVILACHLVMENGWKGLDAEDGRVVELSALLQLLPIHAEAERNEKFRNSNGVARKTFDIANRHPEYQGKPTNGGAPPASCSPSRRPRTRSSATTSARRRGGCSCGGTGRVNGTRACVGRRSLLSFSVADGSLVRRAASTSRRSTGTAVPGTSSATTSFRSISQEKAVRSSAISPSSAPTVTA